MKVLSHSADRELFANRLRGLSPDGSRRSGTSIYSVALLSPSGNMFGSSTCLREGTSCLSQTGRVKAVWPTGNLSRRLGLSIIFVR